MAMANTDLLVTVVGGAGFVGRNLVRSLARRGFRIRVACRRPDLAGHVLPLGTPGQIALVQANVRYPASLAAAVEGAAAVVNATGVDVPRGSQSFDAVLVFGAEAVAKAARAAKANLLITVSGIGAHAEASSAAARAKALGEQAAARAFPGAISVRPSVIFGPDDRFFNRTAAMARYMPLLPLFGGGTTRMQPVFAGDVAEAMAILIGRGEATGLTYELGGPRIATLRELMHFTLHTLQRRRILLPVPWGIARAIGSMAGFLPSPPITADQVEMLKPDNVVSAAAIAEGRDLRGLGVAARSFEAIVPTYLYRFRKEGQFTVPSGTPQ